MQRADRLIVQNVVGRITHGLVGFDLFMQGKRNNHYLRDFLTLSDDELKLALASASVKVGLLPARREVSSEETNIIAVVKKAQEIARKINQTPSDEIERTMTDLEDKLSFIYRAELSR